MAATLQQEPGWYFDCADPDDSWMNNDANGPYESAEDAEEDLRAGQEAAADM